MDARRMELIAHFTEKCAMAMQEAQRVADMNISLSNELQVREVEFKFIKRDGTIRCAHGTMKSDIIPEIKGTGRPLSFGLQLYYDLDKQSFRSFKKENLISYENI